MKFIRPEIEPDLEELIPDFIQGTLSDYEKFSSHYQQKDIEGMKKVCHTILGTAGSYGFNQLDDVVRVINDKLIENNEANVQDDILLFQEYIEFLKKEFNVT